MKFVYPEINNIFDTNIPKINCIIIENQTLFKNLVEDIYNQTIGLNGISIISNDEKELQISKNVELVTSFVPFEINQKNLITKLSSALEEQALSDENYAESMELISVINKYLYNLSFNYNCELEFPKLSIGSIIKSSGIKIENDDLSLPEKVLDLLEITKDLLGNKLFIFINLRSFISDNETNLLMDSILSHQHNVILIDNKEYVLSPLEKRYIIDNDLCEINC